MTKARDIADLGGLTTRLDQVGNSDGALSNRNMIINGAMQVAQRGTSATGVVGSGYYTNDRMQLGCTTNASGTYTLSQSTDAPAGFNNSFKLDCTTANSNPNQLRFNYNVEGHDVSHLNYASSNAQTLTLSFWVKSNVTGTYTVSIEVTTGGRYFASHYTVDTANTWEYKTIQIAGDTANAINTTNLIGMAFSFWLTSPSALKQGEVPNGWVSNSSYTNIVGSGFNVNMASSTSNEWLITGLQLELGDTATPFEHTSYGDQLQKCRRYFYNLQSAGVYTRFGIGENINATSTQCFIDYPIEMRVKPSLVTSGIPSVYALYHSASIIACTTIALDTYTTTHTAVVSAGVSGTPLLDGGASQLMANNNSSTFLAFDAEL